MKELQLDARWAGYLVLRYPGADIWRDPFACAGEVLRVLYDQIGAATRAAYDETPSL